MFLFENASTAALTEQVTSNQMTSAHNTVLQNVYGMELPTKQYLTTFPKSLRCVQKKET